MRPVELLPGVPFVGTVSDAAPVGAIRNATGSNTHVPPKEPETCKKVFADGREDMWLEYVPSTYEKGSNPPLIIACHGGGVDGRVQFDETSWIYIAEAEGAIAVFPYAGLRHAWLSIEGEDMMKSNLIFAMDPDGDGVVPEDAHDIKFICGLIDEMKSKYGIDEGRVYMQGMSMGDMMTTQFARVCGDKLAGAACAAGPTPRELLFDKAGAPKGYKCPVPVYQSRGELDTGVISRREASDVTRQHINAANRRFWTTINGCEQFPRISIRGETNIAYYGVVPEAKDGGAPYVFRDVKYRDHGQSFDDAQWAWFSLFKNTRRMPDGSLKYSDTPDSTGDEGAAALCVGREYAYVNNRRIRLEAPAISVGLKTLDHASHSLVDLIKVLCVPVSFLEQYFDVEVEMSEDGRTADIITDSGVFTVCQESVGCVFGSRIYAMTVQATLENGVLYVPLKWFAENIFGMHTTECGEALYISDHAGEMTKDMEYLIGEILA